MIPEDLCLAVIPARGGSKRIPNKNLRPLAGRPLLTYTVHAALASGVFHRVVVTTDSVRIAQVARGCGASVPFLREPGLSGDFVPVSAATIDALQRIDPEENTYSHVCQLMPNCPLRSASDIVNSHREFLSRGSDSQISVVRYGWQNPWWAVKLDEAFALVPLFEQAFTQRSQDLPPLFCPTGAVWWAKSVALRREDTFHMPGRTGWEIPWTRGIDIDTEDDWDMAEALMRMMESPPG